MQCCGGWLAEELLTGGDQEERTSDGDWPTQYTGRES